MNFLLIILSKEMEIHPKIKYKDIQKSNHQQNFAKIFNSKFADTIRDQQQKNINLKKKRKCYIHTIKLYSVIKNHVVGESLKIGENAI